MTQNKHKIHSRDPEKLKVCFFFVERTFMEFKMIGERFLVRKNRVSVLKLKKYSHQVYSRLFWVKNSEKGENMANIN